MSGARTEILDPTGTRRSAGFQLAPRPEEIRGLTVGLVDIGRWLTWGTVFQHYKEVLKERYGVGDVIYVNQEREGLEKGKERPEVIDDIASKCDVVILGLGN